MHWVCSTNETSLTDKWESLWATFIVGKLDVILHCDLACLQGTQK